MLTYAIDKSDMDLRRTLFSNIVLSGGSTLFRGFGDRLLSEVKKLAPKDVKIRVGFMFMCICAQGLEFVVKGPVPLCRLKIQSASVKIFHEMVSGGGKFEKSKNVCMFSM